MGKKGVKVSNKQSKKKPAYDSEESIDDDGSQTGWNSDEDQIFYNDKDEDYDDEDDLEGGILLSDLIGLNEAKQKAKVAGAAKAAKAKKQSIPAEPVRKTTSQQPTVQSSQKKPVSKKEYHSEEEAEEETSEDEDEDDDVEEIDDNDDEEDNFMMDEDDEEEEVNEEDSYDEEDEEMDEDDDEEEEDSEDEEIDESRHHKLLNAINRFSNVDESALQQKKLQQHYATLAESAIVQSNANSSSSAAGMLGFSALFDHIGDTAGFSAMKTQLKDLEKPSAAPKYIEKVHATRMEREETYAQSKEEVTRWQETVVQNRVVPTLDLAQDKRRPHKAKTLVNSFVPTTDFEKEIQMVMLSHGANDEATERKERELMESSSHFSPEEIASRHAELAKIRSLMFYEQMKRHRMNKIKSKAYRAIKRKHRQQLEMQAEAMADEIDAYHSDNSDNDDNDHADNKKLREEKAAMKRIKERMNLKHKNTSKWARMAMKFGHTDKSLRDAYHESVRMGHDLTRKINEDVNHAEDDDQQQYSEDNYDSDYQSDDNNNSKKTVVQKTKKELQSLLSSSQQSQHPSVTGKYAKLFDMDFMKKASDVQQERAREEAKEVLKELAALENDPDNDNNHGGFQDDSGDNQNIHALMSAAPLIVKKKSAVITSGGVKLDQHTSTNARTTGNNNSNKAETVSQKMNTSSATNTANNTANIHTAHVAAAVVAPAASNPWLDDDVARAGSDRNKKAQKHSTNNHNSSSNNNNSITVATNITLNENAHTKNTQATNKSTNNNGQNNSNSNSNSSHNTSNNKKNNAHNDANITTNTINTANNNINNKRKRSDSVTSTSHNNTNNNTSTPVEEAVVGVNSSHKKAKKQLTEQTQEELVKMAFAGPNYEEDFQLQKEQEISRELGFDAKKAKVAKDLKAGWGDWAGPGAMMVSDKLQAKRDKLLLTITREHESLKLQRQDAKKTNIMISEKRIKASAKYKIADVPHPYSSREEYERAMQMPMGQEWNASHIVSRLTQPEVKKRAGRIITPIVAPHAKKTNGGQQKTAALK